MKQLDDVAGRVLDQDPGAAGAGNDVVAEARAGFAEPSHLGGDVGGNEVDAVPAAGPGLVPLTIPQLPPPDS